MASNSNMILCKQRNKYVDAPDDKGNSILHLATLRNDLKLTMFLMPYGPKVTLENKEKKTPLTIAVGNNSIPILRSLLNETPGFFLVHN